jgi:tRNA(His) 5'-end guanylyltransferase
MTRIKENYEHRSQNQLLRRTPVIMRLDGKAFHTYTKSLNKPFDEGLMEDMQETTIQLCKEIQGVKCAYTQSDEISILITDYDGLDTQAWFDYNIQKMTSISASMASGKFNQLRLLREFQGDSDGDKLYGITENITLANFDSRVFNIPKEEVNNYFIARQRDATRNSISMLAQSLYSHHELHGVDQNQMQELCFQKGHNWNDLHYTKKRGSFIVKNTYVNNERAEIDNDIYQVYEDGELIDMEWIPLKESDVIRTKWELIETPHFSKSNIINSLL